MSAAAKDANVILAVTTHVKQNNNITFIVDSGLVSLFERQSYQDLRKGRLYSGFDCIIVLIEQPALFSI